MKKKLQMKLAVVLCLVAALMCGCGSKKEDNSASEATASTESDLVRPRNNSEAEESEATEVEDEIDPETMEVIKYNVYVELNNYIVEVLDNIDNYYLVVEYADEFSMIQDSGYSYGYGIYGLSTDILEDAQYVAQMEPAFDELDEMTEQIIEPMRTMMEVFNAINDSTDYADNQYAKAKEYHAIIQENAEYFYSLGLTYLDAIDVVADERIAEEEAQMLANGELIIYNSSHAITIVNEIIDECYDQGVTDENLTELDLAPIKEMYNELVATVEAYDAAVGDNEQLVKESLSNPAPFDGLLNSLVQSVDWMIQQVESGQPVSDISLSPLGSLGHVYEVLSQCIDRYNTVFTDM